MTDLLLKLIFKAEIAYLLTLEKPLETNVLFSVTMVQSVLLVVGNILFFAAVGLFLWTMLLKKKSHSETVTL